MPVANQFTTRPAAAFKVDGRVNEGGLTLPFCLEIENKYMIRCTNSAGFLFSACITEKGREPIVCVLADGTAIQCRMLINRSTGRIRLDSDKNGWFWLEIYSRF
jgi:hypothetical protein